MTASSLHDPRRIRRGGICEEFVVFALSVAKAIILKNFHRDLLTFLFKLRELQKSSRDHRLVKTPICPTSRAGPHTYHITSLPLPLSTLVESFMLSLWQRKSRHRERPPGSDSVQDATDNAVPTGRSLISVCFSHCSYRVGGGYCKRRRLS